MSLKITKPFLFQIISIVIQLVNNESNLDKVFGINSTNEEIYQEVGANMVKKAVEGYNCCIFAYGQTSSGKTHTIKGS